MIISILTWALILIIIGVLSAGILKYYKESNK